MNNIKYFVNIITFITLWYLIASDVMFKAKCYNHISSATHSLTINESIVELSRAVGFLERNGYTSGSTSLFDDSDNNIFLFYQTLRLERNRLLRLDVNISREEEYNVLVELRKTLSEDDMIKHPTFLRLYPYNKVWALLILVEIGLLLIFNFQWKNQKSSSQF